jgi:pimeloyl-ACP methyl ester carboxylesterase
MDRFRASDGAELAFSDAGSGAPALLFVHGWQADGSVWRGVIDALGPSVRSVSIDLRGFGASANARGPYALERHAADLRELIDALRAGPAVVVGHSMGATTALRLALDAPRAVRALVLVAPVPASGGGYSPKGEAFLRSTAGDAGARRKWLARTLSSPPDEAALERLCAIAASTPPEAALESFESWAFAGFADATRTIRAPALVIAPDHDAPDDARARVAELLPNARFAVLPNSAHYAIVERPDDVAALIRDFV